MNDLEAALKALRPAAELPRDQVLFQAGRASAPLRWFWPVSTAAMTCAALVLGTLYLVRPEPQPVERIVYVTQPQPPPPEERRVEPPREEPPRETPTAPYQPTEYRHLREQALRWGVDSLPPPAPLQESAGQPQTLGSMLDSMNKDKGSGVRLP
jgi:hypothetical protein